VLEKEIDLDGLIQLIEDFEDYFSTLERCKENLE
jgi:hypothetical protein